MKTNIWLALLWVPTFAACYLLLAPTITAILCVGSYKLAPIRRVALTAIHPIKGYTRNSPPVYQSGISDWRLAFFYRKRLAWSRVLFLRRTLDEYGWGVYGRIHYERGTAGGREGWVVYAHGVNATVAKRLCEHLDDIGWQAGPMGCWLRGEARP